MRAHLLASPADGLHGVLHGRHEVEGRQRLREGHVQVGPGAVAVDVRLPDELLERARIDGAGPMRFFFDILLPLSRTNIAALFVILFIFGWNQYLWPLLVTTETSMTTIVMSIKQMLEAAEQSPQWNIIMMTALLAMLPPIVVVIAMQKLFVQGLTETDK